MRHSLCKDCRWWNDRKEDLGDQFRVPGLKEGDPEKILGRCQKTREFFDRMEDDWCGEWEPRAE